MLPITSAVMKHGEGMKLIVLLFSLQILLVFASKKCPAGCYCNPSSRHVLCDGNHMATKLSKIPTDIPRNTIYVKIVNNKIGVVENGSFASLGQLKFLDLSNNGIAFIQENAFTGLRSVELLFLAKNDLRYLTNAFVNTFTGLENLQELRLEDCRLQMIPDAALEPLGQLKILNLDGNAITDPILGVGFRMLAHLKQLSMSRNILGRLTNSTFGNIKQLKLETLNLINCNITHIEVGTFEGFRHLNIFNISRNPLTITREQANSMLEPLCRSPKLQSLGLSGINLKEVPKTLRCFQQLRRLGLAHNGISALEGNVFNFPHHLQELDLGYNDQLTIIRTTGLKGLNQLKFLSLRNCGLPKFPKFVNTYGQSYLPNISLVNFKFNKISTRVRKKHTHSPLVGLESVQTFYATHNNLHSLTKHLLSPLRNVKHLSFVRNTIDYIEPGAFLPMVNLSHLDLTQNPLKLGKRCGYFAGLSSLKFLKLTAINLHEFNSYFQDSNFHPDCLFEGLIHLSTLDIQDTNLKALPNTFFKDLKGLKKLIMDNNRIETWNDNLFENITALQYLGIAVNQIRTINESSLKSLLPSLIHFQAFSNPYYCDCRLAWYASWVRDMHKAKNFTLKIKYNLPYNCTNIKKTGLQDYKPTFYECHQVLILTTSGSAGFVLLTAIVVGMLYHYRWYLRYWMFLLRSRHSQYHEEQEGLIYTYDCFVTYSGTDSHWVVDTLLRKLEQEFGFRVCIHERDFELGRAISENIAESIEQSRRVLIVLTRDFVQSEWCTFEVNLAHANALHNAQKACQSLIILLMEDVPLDGMTPILRYLIRKQTFIEWTEQEPGQIVFWDRLRAAIRGRCRPASLSDD